MTKAPYGYCPHCGLPGVNRERRPNGYDTCKNGHRYPSSLAVKEGGTYKTAEQLLRHVATEFVRAVNFAVTGNPADPPRPGRGNPFDSETVRRRFDDLVDMLHNLGQRLLAEPGMRATFEDRNWCLNIDPLLGDGPHIEAAEKWVSESRGRSFVCIFNEGHWNAHLVGEFGMVVGVGRSEDLDSALAAAWRNKLGREG